MEYFDDWIDKISRRGLLCGDYADKVAKAGCNKDLFEIVTDANGMTFLMEMAKKGYPLSPEYIRERFAGYINGRCTVTHKTDKGREYTSALYCRNTKPVIAETTLLTFIACKCSVRVPSNHVCKIYIDRHSEIEIEVAEDAQAIVEYWGEAEPVTSGAGSIKRRKH